jgi:hypothetical protein
MAEQSDKICIGRKRKGVVNHVYKFDVGESWCFLTYSVLNDEELAPVAEFSDLKHLQMLRAFEVTDAGLEHLRNHANLESLTLNGASGVTDKGLERLTEFATRLERLSLASTGVTDEGLVFLSRLTRLKELNLSGTKVTDAGLAHIKNLPNLNQLTLNGTKVRDVTNLKVMQSRAAEEGRILHIQYDEGIVLPPPPPRKAVPSAVPEGQQSTPAVAQGVHLTLP